MTVEFIVEADGRVTSPVVRRRPDPALAEAVVAALLASAWQPGIQAGQPVTDG